VSVGAFDPSRVPDRDFEREPALAGDSDNGTKMVYSALERPDFSPPDQLTFQFAKKITIEAPELLLACVEPSR
jgi:hypothetical protein